MRTNPGDKIFAILKTHIGRENAISAPELAKAIGWRSSLEREVRRIIRTESPLWAERDGLVCAVPGGGYFLGTSFEELSTYHTWLTEGRTAYEERIAIVANYCRARGIALAPIRRAA